MQFYVSCTLSSMGFILTMDKKNGFMIDGNKVK